METSLEYEDLLIKLRAKLNENKIKLWEPPYISETEEYSQSLKVCLCFSFIYIRTGFSLT